MVKLLQGAHSDRTKKKLLWYKLQKIVMMAMIESCQNTQCVSTVESTCSWHRGVCMPVFCLEERWPQGLHCGKKSQC